MDGDPLAEGPGSAVCPRCGDTGWVWVTAAFADRLEQPNREGHRAALMNTVYPCRECRPAQFYAWAHGCLDADHDRFNCDRCQAAAERPSRGRARRAPGRPPLQPVEAGYHAEGPDHD